MSETQPTRVALITGAARRVGRAIAERLADAGFDIAFTFLRSSGAADDLARSIREKGRQYLSIQADLEDPLPAARHVAREFSQRFSRLDVLVNNASIYLPDPVGEEVAAMSRRMQAIHVDSPLLLARALLPALKAAGGSIINMVDLQAERPIAGYLAYCASKAGLWNLTLGLARQLAPDVRVNGIAPGVVEWQSDLPEDQRQKYLRRVPLARAGTPEDVARAVEFLTTGAPYVTGQILRLDGGRSIT
jgi:pteridine reductase